MKNIFTIFVAVFLSLFVFIFLSYKDFSPSKSQNVNNQHSFNSIYNAIDKSNIISIHNNKDKTIVIFTDPQCPHCLRDLNQIESKLTNYNVEYILFPILGKNSFIKSQAILNHYSNDMSNQQKISLLRKYYDRAYKYSLEDLKLDTTRVEQLKNNIAS